MSQLLQRLERQYDTTFAVRTLAGQANWPLGNFGRPITHIQTICAHLTAGWPRRDVANNFVRRYTVPGTSHRGEGTQLYISGDGTVALLIDLPRRTGHATWINSWSLGVETGNLGNVGVPPSMNWIQATAEPEDIPGAKLWITGATGAQTEALPAWWTTATYAGPGRGVIGPGHMLFSEAAMQAWALLARYLMAEYGIPRNFPLLPHERRSTMMTDPAATLVQRRVVADKFRRTVMADERAEMLQDVVAQTPINIPAASFDPAQAATLATQYHNAIHPTTAGVVQRHNRAWRAWCEIYRGLHGHGYAGAIGFNSGGTPHHEHDCPGPLFDFHRLARAVSDYWWYPFDMAGANSAVPRRPYRRFEADTPVVEYYFDESEADRTARISPGVHGSTSSPTTFTLNPESPVYAMSNGELIAARFPDPGAGVSMAFTLVRHEVYHARAFPSVVFVGIPLLPDTVDYNQSPESVYTLYMHLGRPSGMSFDTVSEDNPDWLNRLLIRKKECDLGVDFYDNDPLHHGIAPAVWNNRPPGVPQRPTTLEGWRTDKSVLDAFLTALSGGAVAHLPRHAMAVPVRVLLGDFLGESGLIRSTGGVLHGIRVETFAPAFTAPTFSLVGSLAGWNPPEILPAPHCLQYQSEWARVPTPAELAALVALGINPDHLTWWPVVAILQYLDGTLPPASRLPLNGIVFHYEPLAFATWLNGITWASEWPKFEVTDAGGAAVPLPARPRSRRV